MQAHHYSHFRKRYLDCAEGREVLEGRLEQQGTDLAMEMGLFAGQGSLTNPDRATCIAADGKVISPISTWTSGDRVLDPSTGELRHRRYDPDVGVHGKGGTKGPVPGHREVIVSARRSGWYGRAILGVTQSPSGSEIDALIPMIERLVKTLGRFNLLYDTALHGAHIDEMLRRWGVMCIAPVTAAKVVDGVRTERQLRLRPKEARFPDGRTRLVDLWAVGGAACEAVLTDQGNRHFERLRLVQLRIEGAAGKYRLYGTYDTTDGAQLMIPLYNARDDEVPNRAEHLRAFPPGSDVYTRLYPGRSDAEALHRQLEDACWQGRANCYGRDRVHTDVLAFALGENAIARYLWRRSRGDPPLSAAA